MARLIKTVVLLFLFACFYDPVIPHGVRRGFQRTMTSFRVQLPQKFDLSRQEEGPKRSRRFERFGQVSGLARRGFQRTMTPFRVQLPQKFHFSRQEEWPK